MSKKFRGVYRHADNGWTAGISGKYIGWFRDYDSAVSARIAAEIEQIGKPYDVREIEIRGDIALIPMHGRKGVFYGYAVIDLADLEKVQDTSWTKGATGYAVGRPKGSDKAVPLHRFLIYGMEAGGTTDHINGDTLDNRRANLRKCTTKENTRNTKLAKNNTSGRKGVRKTKEGNWKARITVDRKEIHIGHYSTIEEASAAYDAAALMMHGEFARTNASLDLLSS